MISRELQVTLQLAMTEALNRRHEYVCLQHLLFAMLHDYTTGNILRHCGVNLEALKRNAWNVTRSAEETGMQRANFQALMKKYDIRIRGTEQDPTTG